MGLVGISAGGNPGRHRPLRRIPGALGNGPWPDASVPRTKHTFIGSEASATTSSAFRRPSRRGGDVVGAVGFFGSVDAGARRQASAEMGGVPGLDSRIAPRNAKGRMPGRRVA